MKRFYKKIEDGPLAWPVIFFLFGMCGTCALFLLFQHSIRWAKPPSRCTVMCYMNGDNDLNAEVLHAVDMMETVGSSKYLNILALVDGSRNSQHGYGQIWESTRLLHIKKDDHIGVISSPVLQELGELDLGNPETLEKFIKSCLKFPADRYIFCAFAHGQGIIETDSLGTSNRPKSLAISPDASSNRLMTQREFHEGLQKAMGGLKFDLMVFFSCLTNMVEVGYSLRNLTNYMLGSEDVIRIVNEPPGTFQIRGIRFEDLLREVKSNPSIPIVELGKKTVDGFIDQYRNETLILDTEGKARSIRYSGGLSLVRCENYQKLAVRLDRLAQVLYRKLMHDEEKDIKRFLAEMYGTMAACQRYQSFLNLEYYDLQDFLIRFQEAVTDRQIKKSCLEILKFVKDHIVIYEKHTSDSQSNGVSIYLSNFLVPDNIYDAHQAMYGASKFGQDTSWDEMIDLYRLKMGELYADILIDRIQESLIDSDFRTFYQTNPKVPWALRKSIMKGHWRPVMRYLDILATLHPKQRPVNALVCLKDILSASKSHDQRAIDAISRLNGLLNSSIGD